MIYVGNISLRGGERIGPIILAGEMIPDVLIGNVFFDLSLFCVCVYEPTHYRVSRDHIPKYCESENGPTGPMDFFVEDVVPHDAGYAENYHTGFG